MARQDNIVVVIAADGRVGPGLVVVTVAAPGLARAMPRGAANLDRGFRPSKLPAEVLVGAPARVEPASASDAERPASLAGRSVLAAARPPRARPERRRVPLSGSAIRHAVLADLRARLAEPHRHYHGQAHVDALLADLAARRGAFHAPEAVELAVWFHDAVYVPGAADNERASAALLRAAMAGLAPEPQLADAEAMVLATERHAVPPDLPAPLAADLAAFLDMDMAVLGAEPAAYDRYAAGIMAEFVPAVGEARYRLGRAAFLRALLTAGTPLFQTEAARAALDRPARANLRRELDGLG